MEYKHMFSNLIKDILSKKLWKKSSFWVWRTFFKKGHF
jgi:hypothetical protein